MEHLSVLIVSLLSPYNKIHLYSLVTTYIGPRGNRVAWSILERLGRFDRSSNLRYPIFYV